jgi:flavin reductase (DIM6/NTAB) family NADH-FMN oxidoreductase RutF
MAKIITESIGKFGQHYPKIAAIITASAHGKDNLMTAAWHSAISYNPPLYGVAISPKRFIYQLIMESNEFGINFIPLDKSLLAAQVGGISGRETNKFQKFNIKTEEPIKTGVPILKEAYATYECKLVDNTTYGDHAWIVGKVMAVHFLEECFTNQQVLNPSKINPLLCLGTEHYVTLDNSSLHFIRKGG